MILQELSCYAARYTVLHRCSGVDCVTRHEKMLASYVRACIIDARRMSRQEITDGQLLHMDRASDWRGSQD